jgi:hypothetical protein
MASTPSSSLFIPRATIQSIVDSAGNNDSALKSGLQSILDSGDQLILKSAVELIMNSTAQPPVDTQPSVDTQPPVDTPPDTRPIWPGRIDVIY